MLATISTNTRAAVCGQLCIKDALQGYNAARLTGANFCNCRYNAKWKLPTYKTRYKLCAFRHILIIKVLIKLLENTKSNGMCFKIV